VKFVPHEVEHEYPKHVYDMSAQEHVDERQQVLELHNALGFPGLLFGKDGVEFILANVRDDELNDHTGGKSSCRARSFVMANDARGLYHYVHGSHPSNTNDKTMSMFDQHHRALHERRIHADVTYDVYTAWALASMIYVTVSASDMVLASASSSSA